MTNWARRRYNIQKWHAKKRNISWEISFDEWYNWWLQNGIDKKIKNGQFINGNQLSMCRFNDTGPYKIDNIYCATNKQNINDYYNNNPTINCKQIHTPDGIFKSRLEAANFYNIDVSTINRRLKKNPKEYYYIKT
jgi:hypothetical protein